MANPCSLSLKSGTVKSCYSQVEEQESEGVILGFIIWGFRVKEVSIGNCYKIYKKQSNKFP